MQKRSSCYAVKLICVFAYMGRTFQATAGFQDSDIFQKAIEMILRCILGVISHLSGFKIEPGPIHAKFQ